MSANSPGEVDVRASRSRAQIDARFASNQDLGQALEQVGRLSVRLVMLAALAAEVTESLGVDRYQRGQQARLGYRNDHGELHVSTTAGPVALERPRLRGTTEPFASRLLGKGRQPRRCAGVAGAVGVRAWLARPGEAPADGHRWAMYRS